VLTLCQFWILWHWCLSQVLAATQTPGEGGNEWFQGTADAVRQYLWLFEDAKNQDVENVLILSGDHLYRMDYMDFVQVSQSPLISPSLYFC
jgi:ADP-glucose pyrophosphorylase